MDFSATLIQWYLANKRDLPWRKTTDAYTIWLSEIILQQTRVEQGLPYFNRFLEKYPTVIDFANASEDAILNLWQGLGYYSRGRNMLYTAKFIKESYKGEFPSAYEDLIKLKGIGEYTAAAISSFAANEAKAVLDGNVFRVLARYFAIETPINSPKGKKVFAEIASDLLSGSNPALHNQAIMEFGAMLCKPKNPHCINCPLQINCLALKQNKISYYPVKLKKQQIRERFFNYFIVEQDDAVLMKRRDNSDIWAGLYDLPLLQTTQNTTIDELISSKEIKDWFFEPLRILSVPPAVKHLLTHQRIYARFYKATNLKPHIIAENNWFWIKKADLGNYAQPQLIFSFLRNYLLDS